MVLRCGCLVLLGVAATLSLLSDGGVSGTGEQRVLLGREEVSAGADSAFVPPRPSRRSLRSQGPRRRLLKRGSKPVGGGGGSGAGKPNPSIHKDAVNAKIAQQQGEQQATHVLRAQATAGRAWQMLPATSRMVLNSRNESSTCVG